MKQLLIDLNVNIETPMTIYEDNKAAISMSKNPQEGQSMWTLSVILYEITCTKVQSTYFIVPLVTCLLICLQRDPQRDNFVNCVN